jgi:hypothetical protein
MGYQSMLHLIDDCLLVPPGNCKKRKILACGIGAASLVRFRGLRVGAGAVALRFLDAIVNIGSRGTVTVRSGLTGL